MLVRLVTIPLSIQMLGQDRFGLWLTVGSIVGWLGTYDLGLSSGLLNAIGGALGKDDWPAIRKYVSSACFASLLMGLVLAEAVMLTYRSEGLSRMLGVAPDSPLSSEARSLILICGLSFALYFTLTTVRFVANALQDGYLGGLAQLASVALNCLLLFLFSRSKLTSVEFAALNWVPTLLFLAVLAAYVFVVRHPSCAPSFRAFDLASLRTIFGYGAPVFLSQIADISIVYSANILIANALGPAHVTSYAVPATAFAAIGSACYGLLTPYIPAFAEAWSRGDLQWIRSRGLRILATNVSLMSAGGICLFVLGPTAISLWTHGAVAPQRLLLGVLAAYYSAAIWTTCTGTLLIGIGRARTKATIHVIVAAVHIGGARLLIPHLGAIGFPLAGLVAYSIDLALSLKIALGHIAQMRLTTIENSIPLADTAIVP